MGWVVKCPSCGDDSDIALSADIWIRPYVDAEGKFQVEISDDYGWDDDSVAICNECGHESRARDFIEYKGPLSLSTEPGPPT